MIDKLHAGAVMVGNMVGHPQHVEKALAAGVDMIIAQGTEAGGHTGNVSTLPLIPQCVDLCRGRTSPLNGEPVQVVAAGGIFDGRGVAAALALGATGVWVGTRFICAEESAAGPKHRRAVLKAQSTDTTQTLIYSGRPLRVYNSEYVQKWNEEQDKIKELTGKGIIPASWDRENNLVAGEGDDFDLLGWIPASLPSSYSNSNVSPSATETMKGARNLTPLRAGHRT